MANLRQWLRQRKLVRTALETPVDPALFHRPPPRIAFGLALLGLSYLAGWPAIALLGVVAAWLRRPALLVGGPILYGLSWLIFATGLLFIGKQSASAGRAFGLWLVRRLAERFLLD